MAFQVIASSGIYITDSEYLGKTSLRQLINVEFLIYNAISNQKYLLSLNSDITNVEKNMETKKVSNHANKIMVERCSIRKYDVSVKISREELTRILQDAMTAPSSLNLQPWRFVVIDSQEGKEQIKPYMMFNGQQWETSAAIIAIFGDIENMSETERIYSAAVEHKVMDQEVKDKMVEMINSYRPMFDRERLVNSIMFDCGLVAMQIMLSAKNYGYDTNAIGGYMKKELTEALGLDGNRYLPVLLLSIGKADEVNHDSIRYSVADITQWR